MSEATQKTFPVTVPPLGEQKKTVTQLSAFLVKVGAQVKEGDDFAELVTDKAAFTLPAPRSGTVAKLCVLEGAEVKEGDVLGELTAVAGGWLKATVKTVEPPRPPRTPR